MKFLIIVSYVTQCHQGTSTSSASFNKTAIRYLVSLKICLTLSLKLLRGIRKSLIQPQAGFKLLHIHFFSYSASRMLSWTAFNVFQVLTTALNIGTVHLIVFQLFFHHGKLLVFANTNFSGSQGIMLFGTELRCT